MNDIEADALPVDNRCMDTRTPGHQKVINRISNRELFKRHPHYPKTAYGEPVEPKDLIHFVFVYADEDYCKFMEFTKWFETIKSTINNGHTVTCINHESEQFPYKYDDNIHDICERAIFILLFLSQSFCTDKVLRFVTSEAIGKTRLDKTFAKGSLENIFKNQKNDAVRPIHTEHCDKRTYRTPVGFSMMPGIQYYDEKKDLEYVKYQVREMIEESIRRFEKRKTAMENALTGMEEDSTLTTDSVAPEAYGNTSLANNALSDTPGNKQLNKAEALTNGEKQMPQTSKTAEGKEVHLLAEGRNFNDNEIYGFGPPTSQIDTSLEINNGSISRNTIHNATQKTANSQVIYYILALCYSIERLFLVCI